MQALRRFDNMSSIKIGGAAKIADLAMLAVELEEDAGTWRVSSKMLLSSNNHLYIALAAPYTGAMCIDRPYSCTADCESGQSICDALHGSFTHARCCTFICHACQWSS